MKILLINPTLDGSTYTLHFGITSIATFLNNYTQHKAAIIDFAFRRKRWEKYLYAKIDSKQPDVIGITISSPYVSAAKRIINQIRIDYDLPIIVGGYHPTICPDETMNFLDIDTLCIGEGEFTLKEYLDKLENKQNLKGIRGLWFRNGGRVVKNPQRPLIQNLSSLPSLDWDLWEDIDKHLYIFGIIPFIEGRGCPFNCSYCAAHVIRKIFPGYFRLGDPLVYVQKVEEQWRKYKSRGFKVAWFWDPVFTYDSEWLEKFTKEYVKVGLSKKLPYTVYTRVDGINVHKARILKDSSCVRVKIGFETGDEYMLNKMLDKNTSLKEARKAVKVCKKYDISVTGYFMLGGPGETKESLKNTFNFIKALKINLTTFYIWKPLPKTNAVSKLEEVGGKILNNPWNYKVMDNRFGSFVSTPTLFPWELEKYQREFILKFVPPIIIKQIWKQKWKYFYKAFKYLIKTFLLGASNIFDNYANFTYMNEIELDIERKALKLLVSNRNIS